MAKAAKTIQDLVNSKSSTTTASDLIVSTLPFVSNKRPDGDSGRHFWSVNATGDRMTDFAMGMGFAQQALKAATDFRFQALIPWVVADMVAKGEWTEVEHGFVLGLTEFAAIAMGMGMGSPNAGRRP
jgi:hypothetical protein